ncbi:MAG: hypothetical protein IN808_08815, partial [Rubrobacter sp.]|nr:hypothetical protein [Rubrobacter sp.]
MKRAAALLLLLLALPLLLSSAPGPQTSREEAIRKAELVPRLGHYLEQPTVEPSASYDASRDAWRVVFVERASGALVATVSVDDDTGRVRDVRVSPRADALTYPQLSEEEAIKLARAQEEVREELSRHGPYTVEAEYENGEWVVHFYVRGEDPVGGVPDEDSGTKEVARVGIDDSSWQINYVYVGDQVGWNMARGIPGAYGKQANYWWVWGPMALVFALVFFRNDRVLSLRNLDIVALLGFLLSHAYFREGIVYEAVLLWYPPLIYLFLRTLLMGFGIG